MPLHRELDASARVASRARRLSHAGVWQSCGTCHLDPQDFAFFECLLCHQHNQADTDADHDGVEGYDYDSRACLGCHSILGD